MTLEDRFLQFEDEELRFERVQGKRSERRDLHAFLLLDELQPGDAPMISDSGHDEYFLDIDCEALDAVRCSEDNLCLFA
jgi:hypothetical protein